MQTNRNRKKEEIEDIFFGQVVLIWARWFVIAAGVIYALWMSTSTEQLSLAILPLVIIIGINFFVHGRFLMEKPINQTLLLGLSVIDLVIVTIVVLFGPGQRGINSDLFVFYYPLLIAFSFVFSQRTTAVYTISTLFVYVLVCVLLDPIAIITGPVLEIMVMRVVTMAAVGSLGTYYWRIQRDRRHELAQAFRAAA